MYADPKFIKKHSYKVNFDDQEQALVELVAMRTGKQPSALIRILAMEHLDKILAAEEEHNRRSA